MITKYEEIKLVISASGQPDYRYQQIIDAVFRHRINQFEQMAILPRQLREALIRRFGDSFCGVSLAAETTAKQADKALFEMADGNRVEAVGLHYKRGWESFCISSQCGCGFHCGFCATGAIGLKRNLTADEITDQLLYFHLHGHTLNSISFMGMGEALANSHLFDALAILTDPQLFGLSQRRITVSTIGILPGIRRLTEAFPQINLTFSLHSPFSRQRSLLMPVNDRFPLHEVMKALDNHIRCTGRKVYIAYTLLDGINDSAEHANAVADLLCGQWRHLYQVDLIPYNPTSVPLKPFGQSSRYRSKTFLEILKARGIHVTVRTQFGSDINAACGQLYAQKADGERE